MKLAPRLLICSMGLLVVVPAGAQDTAADSISTVQPTPRTRPIGGVRIHSRNNSRPKIILQSTPAPVAAPETTIVYSTEAGPYQGITRQDLDRLAASIVEAIRGMETQVTVVAPPAAAAPPTPQPPPRVETRVIYDTVYVYVPTSPDTVRVTDSVRVVERAPGPAQSRFVEEIERAFLDTGIFRSLLVNFEFGSSTLLTSSFPVLNSIAEVMRSYPDLRVRVAGHTDYVGSDEYNLRLSQARARSVAEYLSAIQGIPADRLASVGFGEGRPIASNESPTGRALNRRVEFEVLNPESAVREQRRTRVN